MKKKLTKTEKKAIKKAKKLNDPDFGKHKYHLKYKVWMKDQFKLLYCYLNEVCTLEEKRIYLNLLARWIQHLRYYPVIFKWIENSIQNYLKPDLQDELVSHDLLVGVNWKLLKVHTQSIVSKKVVPIKKPYVIDWYQIEKKVAENLKKIKEKKRE